MTCGIHYFQLQGRTLTRQSCMGCQVAQRSLASKTRRVNILNRTLSTSQKWVSGFGGGFLGSGIYGNLELTGLITKTETGQADGV